MGHRFHPKHVDKLLNADRQKLLPHTAILERLDVQESHVVADVGCGPGYFTIPMAQRCTTVYGVDVSPEMLDMLSKRAAEAGLTNVRSVTAPAERVPLPDHRMDRVLCAFVLHEVDDLDKTVEEFDRLLKPSGKLMVIEWEKKPMEMGPPFVERLERAELTTRMQNAGFHTELWGINPYHYAVIAEKVEE
ncbi:ubiquinone/menaquinone biosynthesis C-methylase UbiE [Alicyclobacillus sacchari]|uniref:Ubiquinone/menaquinone biosynthesis C-methylase UbiE n=1 Tax=Alicyclobacillus sacchari TaxID=392010 RepID=A0A4R8LLA3_9BACL|nr:methyltransferase domain-containing protein [Alicyclobacillus sacchari]TDY45314.1 ubiquinone/menaquinone biosynthesis C-methylase UbiE [Alicyclobacillus sacchari]